MVSLASSIMKNFVFLSRSRFAAKLICCIAFGSASSAWCLLKSIGSNLFQLIVLLNPDFNCWSSFALSWVDKVATGT